MNQKGSKSFIDLPEWTNWLFPFDFYSSKYSLKNYSKYSLKNYSQDSGVQIKRNDAKRNDERL